MAFYCPECRHKIQSPENEKTSSVVCPECGKKFPIPMEHRKGVLKPGTKIGGYEIIRLIGSGGMGKVYEALQLSLNRRVALKIISPKVAGSDAMSQRFLLEVRATASLEHVNIVTVYEANEQDGMLFLAMELIHGQSVDVLLKETKSALDEKVSLRYVQKVAEAMDYAWRHQNLLHRDIKPANIIITDHGQLKLCDLGIAKRPNDEFDITREGMAIGTPHYMSPEQGQGLLDIDFRSDIYSLGATLYHMATGTLPFDDKSAVAVITKQIVDDLPDPQERNPKLSDPCAALIKAMMCKEPAGRHDSWAAVLKDIDRVLHDQFPVFRPLEDNDDVPDTDSELPTPKNKQKSTVVDSGNISHEIGRMEREKRRQQRGWSLVRIALLLMVLLTVTGTVAYQYRYELLPDVFRRATGHSQLVKPDDGTPPAPPDSAAVEDQDPADAWYEAVSSSQAFTIEDLRNETRMAELIEKLNQRGMSPAYLAYQWQMKGKAELARVLYEYCLTHPSLDNGAAATAALRDLAAYYRETNDDQNLIEVLQQGQALEKVGLVDAATMAYVQLADYYHEKKQAQNAVDVLVTGIKKNRNGTIGVANVLAVRLLNALKDGDPALLWKWSRYVVENMPRKTRAHAMAEAIQKEFAPIPDVTLPLPLDDLDAFRLCDVLSAAQAAESEQERARIFLQVPDFFLKEGEAEKAVRFWQVIAAKHGALGSGEIGGRAMLKLAQYYKQHGKTEALAAACESILRNHYHGRNGEYGLAAVNLLIDYYDNIGAASKRNEMLQMQIHAFPGKNGQNAGRVLLLLAEENIQTDQFARGVRQLHKIVNDFPGANDTFKKDARSTLARLTTEDPEKMGAVSAEFEQYGPFVDVMRFGPRALKYIDLAKARHQYSPDQAFTVECWLRSKGETADTQVLMSQHDGNKKGFLIAIDGGKIVVSYADGRNTGEFTTPKSDLSWWRHLAVVFNDKGARLYLDGKELAAHKACSVDLRGVSPFRVGAFAVDASAQFRGAMQHIIVVPQVRYERDFFPQPVVRAWLKADTCIVATTTGILELGLQALKLED